jgi:hypothetical protein
MSIILTITPDQAEIQLSDNIVLTTDIPSTIFYTFDGSDPTSDSEIYLNRITLIEIPNQYTNTGIVTLKAWATNGVDNSIIVTKQYSIVNQIDGIRKPLVYTDGVVSQTSGALPILGTANHTSYPNFYNAAIAGSVSDSNSSTDGYSNGYDETGQPNTWTNKEYNLQNYDIKYPSVNSKGKFTPGVLPKDFTFLRESPPQTQSTAFKELFDPQAYVVIQNSSDENDLTPPMFNTAIATGYNIFKNGGQAAYANGSDALSTTLQFIKSFYNPHRQELTYYYHDSKYNKWIISTSKLDRYPALQSLGPVYFGKSNKIFVSMLFPPPRI